LHIASPCALYVRLHRRQGNQRVLADWELEEWVERLEAARSGSNAPAGDRPPRLEGPIYFLFGTDWEDQPIINSVRMQAALTAFDQRRKEEYLAAHGTAPSEAITSTADPSPTAHVETAATAMPSSFIPASALQSPSAAASASPAAAAFAANTSAPPGQEQEPEPLAFDYKSFYRAYLSRLSGVVSESRQQKSIGAFFGAKAQQPAAAAAAANPSINAASSSSVSDEAHVSTFANLDDGDDEGEDGQEQKVSAASTPAAAAASSPRASSSLSSFFGVPSQAVASFAPHTAADASASPASATKRKSPAPVSSGAAATQASPAKKQKKTHAAAASSASASKASPSITAFFKAHQ
jgi:hypothetical protein